MSFWSMEGTKLSYHENIFTCNRLSILYFYSEQLWNTKRAYYNEKRIT